MREVSKQTKPKELYKLAKQHKQYELFSLFRYFFRYAYT